MEVVGDGVLVNIGNAAFLSAHAAGEVAEVVDGQGNVGVQRFADRLAVVDGLGVGEHFEVLLETVGDLQQRVGAFGGGRASPLVGDGVGGIQGQFDVFGRRTGGLGVGFSGNGGDNTKVLALDRGNPLPTDEVVVFVLEIDFGIGLARGCVDHDASF